MKKIFPSYDEAVTYVLASRDTSCSGLQRKLRIDYRQAKHLKSDIEEEGIYDGMGKIINPEAVKIVVVGVGGAGCNALEDLISKASSSVGTLAINMDEHSLERSNAEKIIHIASTNKYSHVTSDAAYQLSQQYHDHIIEALDGAHIVFIVTGLGGATGTGVAPLVAEISRQIGALTIAVVSTPWAIEDEKRHRVAREGMQKLSFVTDTLFVSSQPDLDGPDGSKSLSDIMRYQNGMLYEIVEAIAQAVNSKDGIALSLFDLKTLLRKSGKAAWGRGIAAGEDRAILAAERACQNLMAKGIDAQTAKGTVLILKISRETKWIEIKPIIVKLKSKFSASTNFNLSIKYDEKCADRIEVSVIATGL